MNPVIFRWCLVFWGAMLSIEIKDPIIQWAGGGSWNIVEMLAFVFVFVPMGFALGLFGPKVSKNGPGDPDRAEREDSCSIIVDKMHTEKPHTNKIFGVARILQYIISMTTAIAVSYICIAVFFLGPYMIGSKDSVNSAIWMIFALFSLDEMSSVSANAFLEKIYTRSIPFFLLVLVVQLALLFLYKMPNRHFHIKSLFFANSVRFYLSAAALCTILYLLITAAVDVPMIVPIVALCAFIGWMSLVSCWVSAYVSGAVLLFYLRARPNGTTRAAASP